MPTELCDVLRLPLLNTCEIGDIAAVSLVSHSVHEALREAHSCGSSGRLPPATLAMIVRDVGRLRFGVAALGVPIGPKNEAYDAIGEAAAREGCIHSLEWILQQRRRILQHEGHAVSSPSWSPSVSREAARAGHLATLKWIVESGGALSMAVCANAAAGGHLQVLQWLRAHGCPWGAYTPAFAEIHGHHHIKEWAVANGCDRASADLVLRLRIARQMAIHAH